MKRQIVLDEDLKILKDFQSVDLVETLQKNNPIWAYMDVKNKIVEQAAYSMQDN